MWTCDTRHTSQVGFLHHWHKLTGNPMFSVSLEIAISCLSYANKKISNFGKTALWDLKGQEFLLDPLVTFSLKLSFACILKHFHFSSVAQLCPTLCDPMNHSTPGLPVHHQLPELTQTHVHWVGDAIQPSHPLSSPFPPVPNPSQHQSLFRWVNPLHEMAKVLEFEL